MKELKETYGVRFEEMLEKFEELRPGFRQTLAEFHVFAEAYKEGWFKGLAEGADVQRGIDKKLER